MINIKRLGLFLIVATLLAGCTGKVKNPDWVINEVMVLNEENFVDNFGQRNGWIEIYNNTSKTQDLGGRYLTNDRTDPKKYPIPRGDVLTRIPPHQHALFFADEEPFNGTFHLNFKLDSTRENYIALYDNDGKTLLDEIVIPAGMPADKTYGYEEDGIKYDAESGKTLGIILHRVTPSSNNKIVEENPKVVYLQKTDKIGGLLTITAMLVVFTGLLCLYLLFKLSGNIAKSASRKKVAQSGKLSVARSHSNLSGEVIAAISATIHELNNDEHDIESTILTIHQVKRSYSPWSSKYQLMRQRPK